MEVRLTSPSAKFQAKALGPGVFQAAPAAPQSDQQGLRQMQRRLVLVALPWVRRDREQAPLGHLSLFAELERDSELDVRQMLGSVCDEALSAEILTDRLMAEAADVKQLDVAVGVYAWNEQYVKALLPALRSRGFQGRLILGGPQISYSGEGLESIYPNADVFIRGYAEVALRQLARDSSQAKIRGVHYAGGTDLCEQTDMEWKDAKSPWPTQGVQIDATSSVRWETQRGCNFRCSFCQHRQADSRTPVAAFPQSRVDSEIDLLCAKKVARISVLDPVFNMNPEHASRILSRFANLEFKGELSLQCRPELIDGEFLDAAQRLNVCLEFGLQSIHKREYLAIGRPNNMEKVQKVLLEVQRLQIKHEVTLMYGLPEQTLQSFKETVNWCLGLGIPVVKAFPLLLLRGTVLEREQARWNLAVKESGLPVVLSSNSFSAGDWTEMDTIANELARSEGKHPSCLDQLMAAGGQGIFSPNASQVRALRRAS
ncbi:B12-binding domain-containing radical SAM protein [Rhodocyclus tenuis]|uniref:B12-binding domain-containing radical SAM protein n=1 Tax=Rhodocyclus tenuis TaxID=1066 RepID=UPI00190368FE|nr:radical SAM protein [Rhodocyclus tenuis]MBK1681452.1 hypothetical protein [Rhodocyclus tenuis]